MKGTGGRNGTQGLFPFGTEACCYVGVDLISRVLPMGSLK